MKRISPCAIAFKMMYELEQEEIGRTKREKQAPPSLRMTFGINHRIHAQRQYNLPRANEVAAVFACEDEEVPTYRHIAIHPSGQDLQTISIFDAHCNLMTYALLFPRKDEGWHLELQQCQISLNSEMRPHLPREICSHLQISGYVTLLDFSVER